MTNAVLGTIISAIDVDRCPIVSVALDGARVSIGSLRGELKRLSENGWMFVDISPERETSLLFRFQVCIHSSIS